MDTGSNNTPSLKAVVDTDWLLSNFAQFEKTLNGDSKLPLHAKRKAALLNYQRLGFPVAGQEEWKYTNPAPIQEKSFPLFKSAGNSTEPAYLNELFPKSADSLRVTIVNGEAKFPSECCQGMQISSLKEIQRTSGELASLLETHLASHAGNEDSFVAMNTALIDNAIVIHISEKSKIALPIELFFVVDENASKKTILPRVLIVADKHCEVTIIEHYLAHLNEEYSVNSVVEFVAAENSNVNHYRVQDESLNAFHISTLAATVGAYANFSTYTFSFGGKLVRNNVNLTLTGNNCNVVMNGLTAIAGNQHVDNHTLLDNTKPNCESNELYKGIYADSSQGVFSGSIIVRQAAQKTNAIQSNKSLLLSDQAGINTKPQLKIWADDVKCTHGATVGQLDDDAMFYIRSRGVSQKEAQVMLIHAFSSEVISAVKVPALREKLESMLLKKLQLHQ